MPATRYSMLATFAWLTAILLVWPLQAETWSTADGQQLMTGELDGVYGPFAVIANERGSTMILLDKLNDAGLMRVADFLATHSETAPAWKDSESKVTKSLEGRLNILRDGELVDFDPGKRPEPEFYLAYFSASWCPPCRQFTPKLVATYNRLQQTFPNQFELIFVSRDTSEEAQQGYARSDHMPWPMIKHSCLDAVRPIVQWAQPGIPCLLVLTRDGALIFNSFRGSEYIGAGHVLRQFEDLLPRLKKDSPETLRVRHRLAVLQYLRAAGSGSSAPRPYLVELDPSLCRSLAQLHLIATLYLDEQGRVKDATFTPRQPDGVDHDLVKDAENWLFLPKVKNGHAVKAKVELPLD